MNEILANTCPKYETVDGAGVFIFDLCCQEIEVVAKCKEVIRKEDGTPFEYKFEIIDYKFI
jgi:hypothetical protein